MRLHPETAFVVCLCLWIPAAQSYREFAPEDQDGSGDEFSGSGSGDFDLWIDNEVPTTQENPNTTKASWFTDAPVGLPEYSFTTIATIETEPEPFGHITEALLPSPTQITETQPSSVISEFFSLGEDLKGETITISTVAQPETTVPPAEKLPVTPMREEEYSTTSHDDVTSILSVIDQEERKESPVLSKAVTTEAPDMETTTVLLSTSASNVVSAEASGDAVETTIQDIIDYVETNVIPEEPNTLKPTTIESDFDFGNEIPKSGVRLGQPGSDFARDSTSDNESLLERKEVLAGVIAGGVVGLAFAIMLVALMVYRMKKKDEGSYSLDEHKHPNGGYQKPKKQEEFLA